MIKKLLLLAGMAALIIRPDAFAQQYNWANKNGAAGNVNSSTMSLSANSANETWYSTVGSSAASSTRHFGAGLGTSPDIGVVEVLGQRLGKYDANMNLVWNTQFGYASGLAQSIIIADPYNTDQFYICASNSGSPTSLGTTGGFTGEPSTQSVILAKCQMTGTSGLNYLWVRKINGNSDDVAFNMRLVDLGAGKVRIVVLGNTRSNSIGNFSSGTSTTPTQSITIPGGGGLVYDMYISCWEDNAGTVTPLWINTFGNSVFSETSRQSIDIDDNGDVLLCMSYGANTLGAVDYVMRNNSSGTTTSTVYNYNFNSGNRIGLFKLNGADGTTTWLGNDFGTARTFNASSITTDASENIYLNGQLTNTSYNPFGGSVTISRFSANDIAVVVFNSSGTPLRGKVYGGTGEQIKNTPEVRSFVLDRVNDRLYMTGQTNGAFTAGTATIQVSSGYDGFLLCAQASGTMDGISAVSNIGTSTTSGIADRMGGLTLRADGNVVAAADYTLGGAYRLNGGTTSLLTKTSYGYQDVAITSFDGTAASLLNPIAEGGIGGLTSNSITASVIKDGNLVSIGNFQGTMTVGSTTLAANPGGQGGLIVTSDTATGNILDVKAINGNVQMRDIKINPADGSIYIVANTYGGGFNVFGGTTAFAHSQWGAVLMKFDASWNLLWRTSIDGDEQDYLSSLDLDAAGNVYVVGSFSSSDIYSLNTAAVKGSSPIASNSKPGAPYTDDIMLAKYDASGTLQWITTGGSASSTINDIITKGINFMNGAIYIGGSRANDGTTFNFGGSSLASSTAGFTDMFLAKINPSTGAASWLKQWSGNNNDDIRTLSDYNNILYIAGQSNSTSGLTLGGAAFSAAGGANDGFIFGVEETGTEQDGLFALKGNATDGIAEIKIDNIGNIFFVGSTNSGTLSVAGATLGTTGSNDWVLGSVESGSLSPKFAFVSGSVQADEAFTITPGAVGMAFVGGNLRGTATFGTTVLNGKLGGDFAYARVDYPYLAPGAQITTLNTWYKANTSATATSWDNSTANSTLTTLTNTGSVTYNASGSNFNPTFSTTATTDMSKTGILAPNFANGAGNQYTIYTVYKPAATTNAWDLWKETITGTGLQFNPNSTIITGAGGAVTMAKTTTLPTNQYSIDVLRVSGTTANAYLNGTANGSATVSALNTTNAGTFKVGSNASMEAAEVVTYGTPHTITQDNMKKVNTYLGLKYGITLAHDYITTTAVPVYRRGLGYDNNIAGIVVDSNEMLIQKQSRSQNVTSKGDMLAVGMGSIAATNALNSATPRCRCKLPGMGR